MVYQEKTVTVVRSDTAIAPHFLSNVANSEHLILQYTGSTEENITRTLVTTPDIIFNR